MTYETAEGLLQVLLAVVVGGVVGAEREFRTGIGLRTLMLICLGSALFTIYSDIFSFGEGDPRRIAAAVVTGVGFLGGGMILRHRGSVHGLTTAATVWLVAALGMGIGIGQYVLVGVATLLVLAVLWLVPKLLQSSRVRQTLTYEVLGPPGEMIYADLIAVMEADRLHVANGTKGKELDGFRYTWRAYGRPADHDAAALTLMQNEKVREFRAV